MSLARNYDPAVFYGNLWLLSDIQGGGFTVFGNTAYVNASTGSDTSGAGTQGAPYATITKAIALAASGDTIVVGPGTYTEAVIIPSTLSGVTLIGSPSNPHATKWTSATDTITLTIQASNVTVSGFYFNVPTFTGGTPAAIELSSASYAHILNNRFQGQTASYDAIYSPVCNSDNVTIANNDFEYLNTASHGSAIRGLTAGGLSYSDWQILNNKFSSCVTAIQIDARVCLLQGNHIGIEGITAAGTVGAVCTLGIDLSGTSSGANLVHGNYLGGTYSSSLYKVGATVDDWAGNFNIAGITTANPS